MKKLILTITCITVAMFSHGQQGNTTTGTETESYGDGAGKESNYSSYFGFQSGQDDTVAMESNSFFGYIAGRRNVGSKNTFMGRAAGYYNEGDFNVFIGLGSGLTNRGGIQNTFLGTYSGKNKYSGDSNTFIGFEAGFDNISGNGNVFIGHSAGKNETGSDLLYIDNTDTSSPLIYGDFNNDIVSFNGNVGINTTDFSQDLLAQLIVNGKILCEEVEVIQDVLPDYVFQKYYTGISELKSDYSMLTLEEIEVFTKANHHLPEVPSAAEVKENGMQLKDMTTILLQKVEELTLYTIEQEKRIKNLEAKLVVQQ